MGDWKAVRLQPGAPLELYNLNTDLGEKQNVAAQNPEVVAKIEDVSEDRPDRIGALADQTRPARAE